MSIEEANTKTMDRYKRSVLVEVTDGTVHVTLDGQHFVNDREKAREAVSIINEAICEARKS